MISPIVRWQSGNRSSVTTGVDNALTGMGGQRAVQILDDPYGDGSTANYLNRGRLRQPGGRHLQRPGAVHDPQPVELPERHRDHPLVPAWRAHRLQVRWEIFNVVNYVNLGAPITALNSGAFGQIQTAGDPRIMQFALKFEF